MYNDKSLKKMYNDKNLNVQYLDYIWLLVTEKKKNICKPFNYDAAPVFQTTAKSFSTSLYFSKKNLAGVLSQIFLW